MLWIEVINSTGSAITAGVGTGNSIPANSNTLIPTHNIASIVSSTLDGNIDTVTFINSAANPFGSGTSLTAASTINS